LNVRSPDGLGGRVEESVDVASNISRLDTRHRARYLLEFGLVVIAYFLAGRIGLAVPFTSGNVSPFWPPAGIALAATLLVGYRIWPAVAIGAFLVNFLSPVPPVAAFGMALGDAAGPLVGAWLLRRIPGFQLSLTRLADALGLVVLGALGGTAISATVGTVVLSLTRVNAWSSLGSAWLMWWLGDCMGVLIVAPLVLSFRRLLAIRSRLRLIELAGLSLGAIAVCALIFEGRFGLSGGDDVLALGVLPFVIWGAVRFEAAGAASVTLFITAIAVSETASGSGPFILTTPLRNAALLQSFVGVIAVSGLFVAALVSERTTLIRSEAAREARRQGEARFRQITETAREGIWMLDPDLLTVFVNRRMAEMLGVTVEEMVGKPVLAFLFDEDLERRRVVLARRKLGVSEVFEDRYRRKDGAEVWARVSTTPSFDADGTFAGVLAMVSDITEQKHAAAERRADLDRIALLSRAVEQTADGIMVANRDGVIEFVNPAFEATTGYSRDEIVGQTPRMLKSGQHTPAFYRTLWDEILAGRPFRGILVNRKKSGELYWASQTITPITADDGSIAHFVSVLRDITEVRRQQEQEVNVRLARNVQQQFYKVGLSVPGLDIAAAAHPAAETGGDYFDFIGAPRGGFYAVIGDASGHGLGAALVMTMTRAYVRSFAAMEMEVGEVLTRVNAMLSADLEGDRFVTMLLLRIDPASRTLSYASAGHVPGFVLNGAGEVAFEMGASGPPMGLFPGSEFAGASVSLTPGDLIMLLTDGVTESESSGEDSFGTARAIECVGAGRHLPASRVAEIICATAREFAGEEPQLDDMTAVVIKVEAIGPVAGTAS
jgi:phosphoserine phosphatase RsbU/P